MPRSISSAAEPTTVGCVPAAAHGSMRRTLSSQMQSVTPGKDATRHPCQLLLLPLTHPLHLIHSASPTPPYPSTAPPLHPPQVTKESTDEFVGRMQGYLMLYAAAMQVCAGTHHCVQQCFSCALCSGAAVSSWRRHRAY